jgi:hypothetical protein
MRLRLWSEQEVVLKNTVFWDVAPCGSCKAPRLRGTYSLHHQGDKNSELGTTLVVVTSSRSTLRSNVTGSPILVTLMMYVIHSSQTPVLTRATRRENPKSYKAVLYLKQHDLRSMRDCMYFLEVSVETLLHNVRLEGQIDDHLRRMFGRA